MQCRIEGCEREAKQVGYCFGHYKRIRRYGSPDLPERVPVTHCKHGHEFSPANTYQRDDGRRMCRQCMRNRNNEYRQRDLDEDRAWFAQNAGSAD